jgi:hypothetical protein
MSVVVAAPHAHPLPGMSVDCCHPASAVSLTAVATRVRVWMWTWIVWCCVVFAQVQWDGHDYWLVAMRNGALQPYALPQAAGCDRVSQRPSCELRATDGTPEGFRKKSSVLSCEAVSYVSSAYIPACLRQGGRPTLSNAHRCVRACLVGLVPNGVPMCVPVACSACVLWLRRAAECAESSGNIRDDLDEVITLNSVSLIVAEYIPFGSNQV